MVDLQTGLYRGVLAMGGARSWRKHLHEIEVCPSQDLANRSLASALEHALAHVPYYRTLGIDAPRLDRFPVLSKSTLREQFNSLRSCAPSTQSWRQAHTGGSTGEPVCVLQDRPYATWTLATRIFYYRAFLDVD